MQGNPNFWNIQFIKRTPALDAVLVLAGVEPVGVPVRQEHDQAKGSVWWNPDLEVHPDGAARFAKVVATARSDFPNPINNVLAFPGIFRGAKLCGTAVTGLLQPGDNWMMHVAAEQVQPGDVLVAACTTESEDGFFGDLLAASLRARGAAGLVLDGGCRDVATLQETDFPVFSRAIDSPGTVKAALGSVTIPVVCANAPVTLVLAMPPPVIAPALGYSTDTAELHAMQSGRTWAAYACNQGNSEPDSPAARRIPIHLDTSSIRTGRPCE